MGREEIKEKTMNGNGNLRSVWVSAVVSRERVR